MRLGFVSEPKATNSNYRAYQPMDALGRRGHDVSYNREGEPRFPMKRLLSCDAVLIHRFTDAETRQAMQQLHDAGVGLVWDNDDDVTNVPKSNPNYALFSGLNRQRVVAELARVLELTDAATTPSTVLAAQFTAAGCADVHVIENYTPADFARVAPVPHDGIVIACLAAKEHQVDYQRLGLKPIFERLLAEHPDVRFLAVGLGLGLPPERCEHRAQVNFLELATTLAHADIGVAPLVDIPWNQARSNVKLKEYGSAGLAWLASPVGPYPALGERQGGRLVADDGWHDALTELIVDRKLRQKLAKRAQKWARKQTTEANIAPWERLFSDVANRARARRSETGATPSLARR